MYLKYYTVTTYLVLYLQSHNLAILYIVEMKVIIYHDDNKKNLPFHYTLQL